MSRRPASAERSAGGKLAAAAMLAALCAACGGDGPAPAERVSGILITLDTVRADALGCYGGSPRLTDTLDALAAESVVFEEARTVAPITLPAHASMLTGLYPSRHGLRDNGRGGLPDEATTLAERARDGGYQTAAFVSAVVLDRTWGLAQGFDDWSEPRRRYDRRMTVASVDGHETVANAVSWLRARDRSRPFFLWVHLFDAHAPYEPPAIFMEHADGDPYLGEIAKVDDLVERLLEVARAEGLFDEALIVVVGDHGESRGEHGEPTHAVLCYDATMRVPLIVRPPGGAAQRRADPVSVADVYPTFVAALALGAPGDVDGRDLLAEPEPGRGVPLESWVGFLNYGWAPLVGWAGPERKVLLGCDAAEVYDPRTDPGELDDLAADPGSAQAIERARAALRPLLARAQLASDEGDASAVIDGALAAGIAALGYAGAGEPLPELPDPLVPCDLPNPSAVIERFARFERALDLVGERRFDEASAELEDLRAANTRDVLTRDALARVYFDSGRFAEAAPVIEELAGLRPDNVGIARSAGACYERLGRLDDAARHYRRATELDPANEKARADLERVTR